MRRKEKSSHSVYAAGRGFCRTLREVYKDLTCGGRELAFTGNVNTKRRDFVKAAGLLWVPGAFAEQLERTPGVEEGPFYPRQLRLDTDNDLIRVNDSLTPAIGEVAHVSGRLLDGRGEPVRNARIEIWQVDHNGV